MTRFKMLGAAAILSMIATPVFAQAAIQEPGAFAFYHPNADVLNGGRPAPDEGVGAMATVPYDSTDAYAAMDEGTGRASCAQRYRSMIRVRAPSLGMTVAGTRASEAARNNKKGGQAGRLFSKRPRQNETAYGIVATQKCLFIYHAAN